MAILNADILNKIYKKLQIKDVDKPEVSIVFDNILIDINDVINVDYSISTEQTSGAGSVTLWGTKYDPTDEKALFYSHMQKGIKVKIKVGFNGAVYEKFVGIIDSVTLVEEPCVWQVGLVDEFAKSKKRIPDSLALQDENYNKALESLLGSLGYSPDNITRGENPDLVENDYSGRNRYNLPSRSGIYGSQLEGAIIGLPKRNQMLGVTTRGSTDMTTIPRNISTIINNNLTLFAENSSNIFQAGSNINASSAFWYDEITDKLYIYGGCDSTVFGYLTSPKNSLIEISLSPADINKIASLNSIEYLDKASISGRSKPVIGKLGDDIYIFYYTSTSYSGGRTEYFYKFFKVNIKTKIVENLSLGAFKRIVGFYVKDNTLYCVGMAEIPENLKEFFQKLFGADVGTIPAIGKFNTLSKTLNSYSLTPGEGYENLRLQIDAQNTSFAYDSENNKIYMCFNKLNRINQVFVVDLKKENYMVMPIGIAALPGYSIKDTYIDSTRKFINTLEYNSQYGYFTIRQFNFASKLSEFLASKGNGLDEISYIPEENIVNPEIGDITQDLASMMNEYITQNGEGNLKIVSLKVKDTPDFTYDQSTVYTIGFTPISNEDCYDKVEVFYANNTAMVSKVKEDFTGEEIRVLTVNKPWLNQYLAEKYADSRLQDNNLKIEIGIWANPLMEIGDTVSYMRNNKNYMCYVSSINFRYNVNEGAVMGVSLKG